MLTGCGRIRSQVHGQCESAQAALTSVAVPGCQGGVGARGTNRTRGAVTVVLNRSQLEGSRAVIEHDCRAPAVSRALDAVRKPTGSSRCSILATAARGATYAARAAGAALAARSLSATVDRRVAAIAAIAPGAPC